MFRAIVRYFIAIISFLFAAGFLPISAQNAAPSRITISGTVVDSLTGQRVEFITIQEKGKANGTISNTDGSFSLTVNSGSTLLFSCVGYRAKAIPSGKKSRGNVIVKICPADYELREVVVKPRREHYRRRDNPSVALAKNVIAHKNDGSPTEREYFSQERYDRMTYSFNNFDEGLQKMWRKKFDFIDQYIDTARNASRHITIAARRAATRLASKPRSMPASTT